MQEIQGDLWETVAWPDVLLLTTNGDVNKAGNAVMGRGVALQAQEHFRWIRGALGFDLRQHGNQPFVYDVGAFGGSKTLLGERRPMWLGTFPVKHHWNLPADYDLIVKSARSWRFLANAMGFERIILPRPGCGNGGLAWRDVKPLIERHLDDRFIIVDREAS